MITLIKALPAFIGLAAGVALGGFGGSKIATRAAEATAVPCPACNCPPAAVVELAPDFDVDRINNRKGTFSYSPTTTFTNVRIVIEAKDSLLVKQLLEASKKP